MSTIKKFSQSSVVSSTKDAMGIALGMGQSCFSVLNVNHLLQMALATVSASLFSTTMTSVYKVCLKRVETLSDFGNYIWISQREPGEIIGWHDFALFVLNNKIMIE